MSQWYYQLLGEEFGPVTAEVLLELIEDGTISESDPVRPVESADWQPASSYAELQGAGDDVISDLSELSFEFEESGPTARKTAYGTVHAAAEEQSESLPEVKGPVGYFYQVQGVSLGPIPLQSLVQLASGGRLLASDLVQAEGDRLWRTAAEFS
ncbi:MAG: GYF domain-containing protein, partial [Planctomycetaceae bacterium]